MMTHYTHGLLLRGVSGAQIPVSDRAEDLKPDQVASVVLAILRGLPGVSFVMGGDLNS